MNFLTKLFDTYNKGLLYDQLVIDNGEDELLVLKYQKASNSYKKEIIDLKDDISDYELEIKVLHKDLDDATKVEPLVAKPKFLFGMAVYRARRRVVSKDYDMLVTLPKLQHAFDKSTYLHELLTKEKLIGKKDLSSVRRLHETLIKKWKYSYDKLDNWRPIIDSLLSKKIDCEDGAIVLASALGMAGFKEDEVGVVLGWYYPKGKKADKENRFYHAWCVVKVEGHWYILESTSPRAKARLWSLAKWIDTYEGIEWFNWKFDGRLRTRHL